jgi:hypothetical protein
VQVCRQVRSVLSQVKPEPQSAVVAQDCPAAHRLGVVAQVGRQLAPDALRVQV